MELREEIAIEIACIRGMNSLMHGMECYRNADSIISLINKRIEGIENPYKDNDVTFYHQFEQGFNLALQKVKEVIGKCQPIIERQTREKTLKEIAEWYDISSSNGILKGLQLMRKGVMPQLKSGELKETE